MDDFLVDCSFNAVNEGLKFRKSTPCYANRHRGMPQSAESRLPAMLHRAESRLSAMRHSAELKKNSSTTLRYATQCEIQYKIFWLTLRYAAQHGVDSVLCGIYISAKSVKKTEGRKSCETVPLSMLGPMMNQNNFFFHFPYF
jgi:hypothetical protein